MWQLYGAGTPEPAPLDTYLRAADEADEVLLPYDHPFYRALVRIHSASLPVGIEVFPLRTDLSRQGDVQDDIRREVAFGNEHSVSRAMSAAGLNNLDLDLSVVV